MRARWWISAAAAVAGVAVGFMASAGGASPIQTEGVNSPPQLTCSSDLYGRMSLDPWTADAAAPSQVEAAKLLAEAPFFENKGLALSPDEAAIVQTEHGAVVPLIDESRELHALVTVEPQSSGGFAATGLDYCGTGAERDR